MKRTMLLLVALSMGIVSFAHAQENVGTSQSPLVVSPETIFWTKNNNVVPMCWDFLDKFPDANAEKNARAIVIETIQEFWLDQINLSATWESCPKTDGPRHVRVMVRYGDDRYNGNTKFAGMATLSQAAARRIPPPDDAPGLLIAVQNNFNTRRGRTFFRALVAHEFGHILGFEHESQRPDVKPAQCYHDPLVGGVNIGPPDVTSIMNWSYCDEALLVPSLNDIRAARTIYGRHDVYNRGVLFAGGFRSWQDVGTTTGEDERNTLIVEMAGRTNKSGGYYQSLSNTLLSGVGGVLVLVREGGFTTDQMIKTMSDDDLRNTLIIELDKFTRLGNKLQGFSNAGLLQKALGSDNSFIRGVLLAGKFRTWSELNSMSDEDQRNTLIVELANRTNMGGPHYQGLNNDELAGAGAILAFTRRAQIRTDAQIKTMSDDDLRNIFIVEVNAQTGLGTQLQSLTNLQLVGLALGIYPS
jgi:hypothetical protein